MAFSQDTLNECDAIAESADEAYSFGSTPKAFDWKTLMPIILGLVQSLCNPKTGEARTALVSKWAKAFAVNGVAGCVDCLPAKAAAKLRHKMTKRLKVKSASMQDQLVFTAVMAAQHNAEAAVNAMTNAYDNDESDDD